MKMKFADVRKLRPMCRVRSVEELDQFIGEPLVLKHRKGDLHFSVREGSHGSVVNITWNNHENGIMPFDVFALGTVLHMDGSKVEVPV